MFLLSTIIPNPNRYLSCLDSARVCNEDEEIQVHFLLRPDLFISTNFYWVSCARHFATLYRGEYTTFIFIKIRGILKVKQYCFPLKYKNPSLNMQNHFPSNLPYKVNFYQANTIFIIFFLKWHLCFPEDVTLWTLI